MEPVIRSEQTLLHVEATQAGTSRVSHKVDVVLHRAARMTEDLSEIRSRSILGIQVSVETHATNMETKVPLNAEQAISLGTALIQAGEQMQMENAKPKTDSVTVKTDPKKRTSWI